MKKTLVYLVLVLLMFSGCGYFDSTIDFTMNPFDEAACYTVDDALTSAKTFKANTDPYFLDDKNVNALVTNADENITITTKANVILVTGDVGVEVKTRAFAVIDNYYDDITTIELYLHKTTEFVDTLLAGQTYDDVKLTSDRETDIVAYFDSVRTTGAEQDFTITDVMGKFEFFKEVVRLSYGKNGSIPELEIQEKPFNVKCEAVETMSLYSYLNIDAADEITFYYNDYMSMRIWDSTGTRIPMFDNNINLEMAAEFGDRADEGSGRVLSKCVYNLEEGKYFVRWIRAESTKNSSQFTSTNPESITNYYRFKVGIFPSEYMKDSLTVDIAEKLAAPTVMKELRSAAQCDSIEVEQRDTLWQADEKLVITHLLRSADKMNALLSGLDSITYADLDKGLHLSYDPELPQGLFFLAIEDSVGTDSLRMPVEIDTLSIYVDGGTFTLYKLDREYASGGKKFNPFTANVMGLTFREIFVSQAIDNVLYFYNYDETLYIVAVNYDGDNDGINMVIKGS
jgi:hypothetical protein